MYKKFTPKHQQIAVKAARAIYAGGNLPSERAATFTALVYEQQGFDGHAVSNFIEYQLNHFNSDGTARSFR